MIKRRIEKISVLNYKSGFLGAGHRSAQIVGQQDFENSNPFIVLMDDHLDLSGTDALGGPHPHAGVEIYTFLLEGESGDTDRGTMELMRAGKGVIHTEEIVGKVKARVFQLWVILPEDNRGAEPFLQRIDFKNVPTLITDDSQISVYAGDAYGLTSPLRSNTPLTIVDFHLSGNVTTTQSLPASYNGFIVVTEGSLFIGSSHLRQGETAWLNRTYGDSVSEITYQTGSEAVRFIFYAGEPQKGNFVAKGPFISGSQEEIATLYQKYRNGEMKHIEEYPLADFTTGKGKTMN